MPRWFQEEIMTLAMAPAHVRNTYNVLLGISTLTGLAAIIVALVLS